jgi:Ca2+-binding EF-hand superfamily protein
MRRYDRNNDGHLDRDELRDGRWSDDPFQYDRNKDGRLSRDELAMRYAKRRSDEEQQRASSSSRSSSSSSSSPASSGSSSGGTGSSSSMTDTRIRYMVDDTFRRYDANNSGAFERDEWSSFRTDPSEADKNRDGRITRDELTEWMAARFGGSGGPGGASGSSMSSGGVRGPSGGFGSRDESSREGDQRGGWFGSRGSSRGGDPNVPARSGDNSAEQRKSFRFASPTERLPSGLPDWFARCDADSDGQVRMSEFASQWSTATVAEFLRFDLNGDGLITPEECLQAKTAGAVRGDSPLPASSGISAGASSSGLSSRSPSAAIAAAPVASASAPAVSASAPAASSSGSIDASYLRYAEGLIKKYDTDGDGELTASEWNKMSRSPDGADADGNGRITVEEYARSLTNR